MKNKKNQPKDRKVTKSVSQKSSKPKNVSAKEAKKLRNELEAKINQKKFRTLKKRYNWALIIILPIAIVGITYAGSQAFYDTFLSREAQIERIYAALETTNPDKIAPVIYSSDKHDSPSAEDTKALSDYLKIHKHYLKENIPELKNVGVTTDGVFKIEKVGNAILDIPIYKLVYDPKPVKLYVDPAGLYVFVNDQKVGETTEQKPSVSYTPPVPGTYMIKAQGEVLGKTYKIVKQRALGINRKISALNQTQEENITENNYEFTIVSDVKEGDVYADDLKIGELDNGEFEVPVMTDSSMTVFTIKSNGRSVSKELDPSGVQDQEVTINFPSKKR